MSSRISWGLVLISFAGLAAGQAPGASRPAIDAFLSRRDVRPLVEPRDLSPMAREILLGGSVSSVEPRLGVPTFFWSSPKTGERSFRDMGLTPEEAARRYLFMHLELYKGAASRWAEAQVAEVHDLHDGGAVIVRFQQRIKGVRVFRDELKVIMTSKLGLVALAGYLTPETKVRGEFSLAAESAVGAAFQNLAGRSLSGSELSGLGPFAGGYEHWRLEGAPTPVRTRPVYFPLPDGVVPGFYVELDVPTSEHDSEYYSFVISAVDGVVLYRKNLTAADAYTYSVWADTTPPFIPFDGPHGLTATPHPAGSPSAFNPGTVSQNRVTLEHAGLSTLDPWLPPGANQTMGNNVRAYADLSRPSGLTTGFDPIGMASSANTFDYTYNFNGPVEGVASQQQAAITQLFFNNNFFHDWYYDDGFNEGAGNAQASNRGRGGLSNDPLLAEAQDYSGRNNANMSTPSDGISPRMQMFVFDGDDAATLVANTSTPQNFNTRGAEFGAKAFSLTAPLMLANDGDSTPTDGCAAAWPANSAAGKIVLIDRGTCTFVDKAEHAQAAGAVGVIIANNSQGGPIPLTGMSTATIPVMSVSQTSGATLKGIISSGGGATTVTLSRVAAQDRDGTLDNGVVAHEWGHYISNRLIGDGNGISTQQAGGMGEGWGDFHAALLLVRQSDLMVPSNANWNGTYALAGWSSYATDVEGYYFGFRRYPLSVDFAKNPLTFKHIADGVRLPSSVPVAFGTSGADNSEVHNTGEVWAVMLWECYVALLRDPRHTFSQAQARMKRYLVAGYKATPLMPTFIDSRDGLLASVAAAGDPADLATMWAAFARRGLGMGAIPPDRDSQTNAPVTESFEVGNAIAVTRVALDDSAESCDRDGNLDANERGKLTITLKNTGTGTLPAATVSVTAPSEGLTLPQGGSVTVPAIAPFGTATVSVDVALSNVAGPRAGMFNIMVTEPSLLRGPVSEQASFRLNFDVVPNSNLLDDVESPMSSWTSASDPNGNTASNFRIYQSTATQHFWFGPNPSSPADTWLISPPLQVGTAPVTISFKHRFDFEQDSTESFDGAVVEVSNDGTNWTDVGPQSSPGYTGTLTTSQNQGSNPLKGRRAFVGKSDDYPMFNLETVNLGTLYMGQTIRFRFRIGSDDAVAAKGWEIDDIQITGITNKPFPSITSDPNTCTNRAPAATIGPNIEVFERDRVVLIGSATDPDGDPVTLTWTQLAGPQVTIASDNSFTAPEVEAETALIFQMTASDGRAVTQPLEQTVLVKNLGRPPVASAPATLEANMGVTVFVQGSGMDPDGDALTYEWSQVSGPAVYLVGVKTNAVSFQAPVVASRETITLQLVVRDGRLESAPALVEVTVKNPGGSAGPAPCGCTSGLGLVPLAGLWFLFAARRRRSSAP